MCSTIAFSIDLLIAGYYIAYLTCVKGVAPERWEEHWGWGFAIATGLFFLACISFTVAAWNVWWIFTPLMLFLFFMGFITVVSYIPDFGAEETKKQQNLISTKKKSTSKLI